MVFGWCLKYNEISRFFKSVLIKTEVKQKQQTITAHELCIFHSENISFCYFWMDHILWKILKPGFHLLMFLGQHRKQSENISFWYLWMDHTLWKILKPGSLVVLRVLQVLYLPLAHSDRQKAVNSCNRSVNRSLLFKAFPRACQVDDWTSVLSTAWYFDTSDLFCFCSGKITFNFQIS